MKARRLYDGSIALSGEHVTLAFSRIWAGVGWPDNEQGALCVVGESLERVYHAVGEWRGSLFELGDAAAAARRDYLVDYFWVDASDHVAVEYFRRLDSMCGHVPRLRPDRRGSAAGPSLKSSTPPAEDCPAIVGVRAGYREHFRAALETVRVIAAARRLVVHEDLCPGLAFGLRRDLDYMLKSPVTKALVWVLTAMESASDHGTEDVVQHDPWYLNLPRRPG